MGNLASTEEPFAEASENENSLPFVVNSLRASQTSSARIPQYSANANYGNANSSTNDAVNSSSSGSHLNRKSSNASYTSNFSISYARNDVQGSVTYLPPGGLHHLPSNTHLPEYKSESHLGTATSTPRSGSRKQTLLSNMATERHPPSNTQLSEYVSESYLNVGNSTPRSGSRKQTLILNMASENALSTATTGIGDGGEPLDIAGSSSSLLGSNPFLLKFTSASNRASMLDRKRSSILSSTNSISQFGGVQPPQDRHLRYQKSSSQSGFSSFSIQSSDEMYEYKNQRISGASSIVGTNVPNYEAKIHSFYQESAAHNDGVPEVNVTGEMRQNLQRTLSFQDIELGCTPSASEYDLYAQPSHGSRVDTSSDDVRIPMDFDAPAVSRPARSFVRPEIRRFSESTMQKSEIPIMHNGGVVHANTSRTFTLQHQNRGAFSYPFDRDVKSSESSGMGSNSNLDASIGITAILQAPVPYQTAPPLELGTMNASLFSLAKEGSGRYSSGAGIGNGLLRVQKIGEITPLQATRKISRNRRGLIKSNSCSTLFVDYTLIMADFMETVTWFDLQRD